jgi:hypothetical protein
VIRTMTLFAETGLPTLIVLALLAVMIGVMLLRVQRYYARPRSSGPSAGSASRAEHSSRTGVSPGTHQLGAAREMIEWEVQMHDLVREMSGQMNSKMAALEHLVREADRAAARLEAALDKASRSREGQAREGQAREGQAREGQAREGEAPAEPQGAGRLAPEDVSASTGPAQALLHPASQADALRPPAAGDQPHGRSHYEDDLSAPRPSRQRRHEEIYTLADYGYAAAEIAQRVGTPVGEIELILSLREKR